MLADPVVFLGGGETLIIEMPDGTTNTVNLANNVARTDVVTRINMAWAALNVTAALDSGNHLWMKYRSNPVRCE